MRKKRRSLLFFILSRNFDQNGSVNAVSVSNSVMSFLDDADSNVGDARDTDRIIFFKVGPLFDTI